MCIDTYIVYRIMLHSATDNCFVYTKTAIRLVYKLEISFNWCCVVFFTILIIIAS